MIFEKRDNNDDITIHAAEHLKNMERTFPLMRYSLN